MAKVKISIIGAGSTSFSLKVVKDVCLTPGISGSTISFMDINKKRLEIVCGLARRYAKERKMDLKFERTTDRRKSLENADFVINSALVVGHEKEEIQWRIAKKHGYRKGYFMNSLLGDEAFFTTFYQWKMIRSIVRDMEKFCPDAWYIQLANPQFAGIHARTHPGSKIKRVGLCHGISAVRDIVKVLGLNWDDVKYQAPGINHFIWLTHFFYKGKNAYPILDKWIEKKAKQYWSSSQHSSLDDFMGPKAIDLYKTFGLFPIGDTCTAGGGSWPWWYHTNNATEKQWKEAPDKWYDKNHESKKEFMMQLSRIVTDHTMSVSNFVGQEKSLEAVVSIIDSLVNDKPEVFQVNIPNCGAIPGIPDDVIVEIPALVSGQGIQGLHVGNLPKPIMLQMKLRLIALECELEAYITGSKNLLLQMILLEPWTRSMAQAKAVLDEILSLPFNKDMAKHFK